MSPTLDWLLFRRTIVSTYPSAEWNVRTLKLDLKNSTFKMAVSDLSSEKNWSSSWICRHLMPEPLFGVAVVAEDAFPVALPPPPPIDADEPVFIKGCPRPTAAPLALRAGGRRGGPPPPRRGGGGGALVGAG